MSRAAKWIDEVTSAGSDLERRGRGEEINLCARGRLRASEPGEARALISKETGPFINIRNIKTSNKQTNKQNTVPSQQRDKPRGKESL